MENELFNQLFQRFKNAGQNALIMNHYELKTFMDEQEFIKELDVWRNFLLEPRTQEFIKAEFALISESNMRKLISAVDEDDRSAGRAQLINAMLTATRKDNEKRDGTIIIYSYIAPNEQQSKATNTEIIKRDPFKE